MQFESVQRGMNMEADDVLLEQPVVATALVAAVATAAYVGVQAVLDGSVDALETVLFVVAFTLVYVAGNRYLRRRESEDATDAGTDTTHSVEK